MRILYLSNSFPLISETFVINEIADLLKLGADIRIVAMAEPEAHMRSSQCEELGFANRIYYRPSLKKGKLAKLVGVAKYVLSGKKLPSGAGEFSAFTLMETARACEFADGWKPDAVHCHFGTLGNLGAALKHSNLVDGILTTTFHGYDVSKLLKEKPKDYYDLLFKTGDHFFSINNYYLDIIHKLGAPEAKTALFHMGVDCEELSYAPRRRPESGTIECVSVGRMMEKKGFANTIGAFAKLLQKKPDLDIRLNLVGDGPLFDDMRALATSLGVESRIVFHGSLQHSQVQALLEKMHIFLLPSVTAQNGDMEGIPVALMEAMAMGLPTFSTYHSGIPELIEDGVSGYLVEEKNEEALSDKLLYLLDRPEIWPGLTDNARRKVETEFNRKRQAETLYKNFQDLTGKN